MFANTQLTGVDMGFPDVCLTPAPPAPAPVPIPYPNVALANTAVPGSFHILVMGAPVHNMATSTPMTSGDNPGLALGVASGMVMGPARHLAGKFTTIMGGAPITRLGGPTLQNGTNAPGVRVAPSQVTVLVLAP